MGWAQSGLSYAGFAKYHAASIYATNEKTPDTSGDTHGGNLAAGVSGT